jgi:hypothetical protein
MIQLVAGGRYSRKRKAEEAEATPVPKRRKTTKSKA